MTMAGDTSTALEHIRRARRMTGRLRPLSLSSPRAQSLSLSDRLVYMDREALAGRMTSAAVLKCSPYWSHPPVTTVTTPLYSPDARGTKRMQVGIEHENAHYSNAPPT